MGRSVETRSDALIEVYAEWGNFEDYFERCKECADPEDAIDEELAYQNWCDFDAAEDWQFYKEDFIYMVRQLFPSFYEVDRLPEGYYAYYLRETSVYLENQLLEISISEYCGLTYIAVAPRSDVNPGLAKASAKNMQQKFEENFGEYRKVGSFGNGESLYALA